jgi:uncharacterized protein YecT (DUF1311 family)
MRKRIVGSIAFVVVAVSAYGPGYCFADDGLGQKYPALAAVEAQLDRCREHKGNIGEMLCAVEADKSVDAILNSLYGKIIAKLKQADDPNHDTEDRHELLKRLIASERAWITYREAECSHASAIYLGGSGEGTALAYCRLEMRTGRANDLYRFYAARFPDLAN